MAEALSSFVFTLPGWAVATVVIAFLFLICVAERLFVRQRKFKRIIKHLEGAEGEKQEPENDKLGGSGE